MHFLLLTTFKSSICFKIKLEYYYVLSTTKERNANVDVYVEYDVEVDCLGSHLCLPLTLGVITHILDIKDLTTHMFKFN